MMKPENRVADGPAAAAGVPARRWNTGWQVWFAGASASALLLFLYRYLDVVARGRAEPFAVKLIEEFTGVYGAALLFIPTALLTRLIRDATLPFVVKLLAHGAGVLVFSLLHTTWNWATRSALFPVAGLGAYDYGVLPVRYLMELGIDVLLYSMCVAVVLLLDHYRATRSRELRLARAEAELGRARMAALEARLQPHFLFNALNTVSSVMYEDLAAADRILARLGDLLRRSLRVEPGQEVALRDELETLDAYLEIARARFGDRLDVTFEVADDTLDGPVPVLLLQPLVENALRHGDPGPGRAARVRVGARRAGDRLILEVSDNGPGLSGAAIASEAGRGHGGIGLSNTARRLELLHGSDHRFELRSRPGEGLTVVIDLPIRPVQPREIAERGEVWEQEEGGPRSASAETWPGAAGMSEHDVSAETSARSRGPDEPITRKAGHPAAP